MYKYFFESKKSITCFLSLVMLISGIFPSLSLKSYAADIDAFVILEYESEGDEFYLSYKEFDTMIEAFEKFVSVEEGNFVFDVASIPFYLFARYGTEIIEGLQQSVYYVNKLAYEGALSIKSDLSIDVRDPSLLPRVEDNYHYAPGNPVEFLPLNSRNVNRRTWHWWGTRTWMSRATARNHVISLGAVAAAGQLARVVSIKAGFFPTAVVGTLARVIATRHASAITLQLARDTWNGVIVDVSWALVISVRSQ